MTTKINVFADKNSELYFSNVSFKNNQTIVNVDFGNSNILSNNMNFMFNNCQSIQTVKNIPTYANLYWAFNKCTNLTAVTAKNYIVAYSMNSAFFNCSKLTTIPPIYTDEKNVNTAFKNCTNLGAVNLHFYNANDFRYLFNNCNSVSGDIYIYQYNAYSFTSFQYSFPNNSSIAKNVYVPFYYPNGVTSNMYNTATNKYYGCTNNTSVTIKNNPYALGDSTFLYQNRFNTHYIFKYIGSGSATMSSPYNGRQAVFLDNLFAGTNVTSVNMNNTPFETQTIMNSTFNNCQSLTSVTHIPNTVTEMNSTFANCKALTTQPTIPNSVTKMAYTFNNCTSLTSASLPNNVVNAHYVYNGCNKLTTTPTIPNSVTNMSGLFRGCNNISTLPSITNNVINMTYAFSYTNIYNISSLPDGLNNLDSAFWYCQNLKTVNKLPSNVKNMHYTFGQCHNLSYCCDIPNGVTNINSLFYDCNNLTTAPNIPNSVIDMQNSFYCCTNLTTAPNIPNSVANLVDTFNGCRSLTDAPSIPNSVTTLARTFAYCNRLVNVPIIPNSVTNMEGTFANCNSLVNAPIIPNSVTIMYRTFSGCTSLINPPTIPNSVTNMGYTFNGCTSLINPPIIPNGVTNMVYTFNGCESLVNPPNIPDNVTNMAYTFTNCYNLGSKDFIFKSVTNFYYTFANCSNYSGNIYIEEKNVTNAANIFLNSHLAKNIYIPFYRLDGTYTNTYNSFFNAGYSPYIIASNTYIKDYSGKLYYNIPQNASLYVEGKLISNSPYNIGVGSYNYEVYHPNYTMLNGIVNIGYNSDTHINITQMTRDNMAQISFNVTPSTASCIVNYGNYSYNGNALYVPKNTKFVYTVSNIGYYSETNSMTVSSDTTIPVSLNTFDGNVLHMNISPDNSSLIIYNVTNTIEQSSQFYPLIFDVTPNSATIRINALDKKNILLDKKTIYVTPDISIQYSISDDNYYTQSGNYITATGDQVISVELEPYCCVPWYSQIQCYNGETKNAEDINIGDLIIGYDEENKEYRKMEIINKFKVSHHKLIKLIFEDDTYLELSLEHPVLTIDGWRAYEITKKYKNLCNNLEKLNIGDKVINMKDGNKTIKEIQEEFFEEPIETYTFDTTNPYDTYIADDCVVHNAPDPC